MSRDLQLLAPEFKATVDAVLRETMASFGVRMVPYFTDRTPEDQAKLWRQSRPTAHITQRIERLEADGAPYLAHVIRSVGPVPTGPSVTGALPGESWHQYGMACDCYWDCDGQLIWDPSHTVARGTAIINGYGVYQQVAQGLGAHGTTFGGGKVDWPHIQATPDSSPLASYTWPEVDAMMKSKYSHGIDTV